MRLALEILGAALLAGGMAALAVGAAGLAWGKGRWKIYAATYRLTRALAQRAERLHHWACRLPKEPPPPGLGGVYSGPILLSSIKGIELDGQPLESFGSTCEHCDHEDGGHYGDCATVHKSPFPTSGQILADEIEAIFRRAGMTREIEDPND